MSNMHYRNGRWVNMAQARAIRDERLKETKANEVKEVVKTPEEIELEALRLDYTKLYEKEVPNNMKNKIEWMEKKIKEFTK